MVAMKDLVESSQTPLIGSNASPSNLGGVYIWRTSFIPAEPSKALGGYLAINGGARTAIMTGDYNGDGAGQDEIKGFLDTFNAANGTLAGTDARHAAVEQELLRHVRPGQKLRRDVALRGLHRQ